MPRVEGPAPRIEALGVAGAPARGRLTTTFRLTRDIVLDTGAAAHGLPADELRDIATILLSHSHLDHTLGLPFLVAEGRPRVIGLRATLDAVRDSLLDGRIWPDLADRAQWQEIAPGDTLELGPWRVEAHAMLHTVPCLGFVCRAHGRTVVLAGDTRRDDAVIAWAAAARPQACVVEVSWPDAAQPYAREYCHQTPCDLRAWREALGPDCRILVTHVKPAHEAAVRRECEALRDPSLGILRDGDLVPA
jgi:ribonuclease BN (tRNA processing enzyme)